MTEKEKMLNSQMYNPMGDKQLRNERCSVKNLCREYNNLPFEDETFDLVTMGFGLRNIENANLAIDEVIRVLKPDGIFMHLDFSKTNPAGDFIFDMFVPFLVHVFYNNTVPYEYLVKSKQEYFNPQELVDKFQTRGLKYVTQNFYALNMMCATVMKR